MSNFSAIESRPLLVTDQINELLDFDDDDEFFNETVDEFEEQMQVGLEELNSLWATQTHPEFSKKAHFLKGSCLALGCERVAFILSKLEIESPGKDDEEFCIRALKILTESWQNTLPLLKGYPDFKRASE
ncbi:hypothetical protein SARC_05348 [Sphaeroforma arctica JP610]|uniref:HPt domain-containing protein n=1 Tax=Sphaeroforma arctica JP610 TaxID=667725 RepID=A0A0L0FZT8_9EUKA|nr:hypothetical protein SARC_05348 [Sphaeroforma arctica JP610]KNC82377.1 hypothetical protein SARC_05348 [Sphaeroforma arctica JP610]|eukprot:XP_014156279.1 hypothetical protein SARC_05348 [Sphaeroforma arctica JP610]